MSTVNLWNDEGSTPSVTTWVTWNIDWSDGTTSVSSNEMWYGWNAHWTTGTYVICGEDDVWRHWNTGTAASATIAIYPDRELTPEEAAAAAERDARLHAEAQERMRVLAEAKARAQALLEEGLDEDQRAELQRERHFTVESRTSKRRYRIKVGSGRHGNIEEVDEQGTPVRRLCCAPVGNIPEPDAILGQKLFLEHDEEAFRRSANITELRRPA